MFTDFLPARWLLGTENSILLWLGPRHTYITQIYGQKLTGGHKEINFYPNCSQFLSWFKHHISFHSGEDLHGADLLVWFHVCRQWQWVCHTNANDGWFSWFWCYFVGWHLVSRIDTVYTALTIHPTIPHFCFLFLTYCWCQLFPQLSQITNSVQCLGINNGMANEESAFLNKLTPVFYKTMRRRDRDQRLMWKKKVKIICCQSLSKQFDTVKCGITKRLLI